MIRVAHFVHSAVGGAGRAAFRTHLASLDAGFVSFLFCVNDAQPGSTTIRPDFNSAAESQKYKDIRNLLQWEYIRDRRTSVSDTLFSICFPGVDLQKSAFFENIDVFHFHWISWMVTPATIGAILKSGKKVVWTLHDMWPFTGGCHYASGCRQYETRCSHCPQVRDNGLVVPQMFEEKRRHFGGRNFSNLTVISPSRWLASEAGKSEIFRQANIKVVPNAIDHEEFYPVADRERLRAFFGLGEHDQVILFGSVDNAERRKGAHLLRTALEDVVAWRRKLLPRPKGRLVFAVFGNGKIEFSEPVSVLNFSELQSEDQLRNAYNIADVFVLPSLEDNYPNTVLESLACGTPVIGFNTGGVSDLVTDGITGLLCNGVGSTEELANALRKFLTVHFGDFAMRKRCVSATSANSLSSVGKQLHEIYSGQGRGKGGKSSQSRELAMQASKTLNEVGVTVDVDLGELTRAFPTRHLMANINLLQNIPFRHEAGQRAKNAEGRAERRLGAGQEPAIRVGLARHLHLHHAAQSGPHHFAKYIGDEFLVTEIATPLGQEFVPVHNRPALMDIAPVVASMAYRNQLNSYLIDLECLCAAAAQEFDIIHFIDGDLEGWSASKAINRLSGSKRPRLIVTIHQPPSIMKTLFDPSRLNEFDKVIVLCADQKDYLSSFVPADLIEIIPHGIDVENYKPDHAIKKRQPSKIVAIAVGAWLRDYEMLEKVALVAESISPNVSFRLIGAPELQARRSNTTILKNISDSQLRAEYTAADILFLPVKESTANNAILEAMASGLPIVSSDVGGVREMTGHDAAVLARPGDVTSHVDALLAVAGSEELRQKMGASARKRALGFDWKIVGQRHAGLYRDVLETR